KLAAAKEGHVAARKARGSVEAGKLRERLSPHLKEELGEQEKRSARLSFAALHRIHGDLTLHRIEGIAGSLGKAVTKVAAGDEEGLRKQFRERLAALQGMVEQATAKGVTGKVEGAAAKADTEEMKKPKELEGEEPPPGATGPSDADYERADAMLKELWKNGSI